MATTKLTTLQEAIRDQLQYYLGEEDDGYFYGEVDADFRDEMSEETANKILQSENPWDTFHEVLSEMYEECIWEAEDDLVKKIVEELSSDSSLCPDGLDADLEGAVRDYVESSVCINPPEKHFLDQDFCSNIMVDTGDGSYDFVLNDIYPAYCGYYNEGEELSDSASLVWLSKQQGYAKERFQQAVQGEEADRQDSKFLKSVYTELVNVSTHMNALTFLVKMTLQDLLHVNETLRALGEHKENNTETIVISKDTPVGLYDPWNGGGSLFGIELEKDVVLPIKHIRSILPDGGDGCSIRSVYGVSRDLWSGEVKSTNYTA